MTDFDPFAYAADVKTHPENYVRISDCIAEAQALHKIRYAPTLQVIRDTLRAAKASGDTELLAMLIERATQRKNELGGTK